MVSTEAAEGVAMGPLSQSPRENPAEVEIAMIHSFIAPP
jgi:hypothetical protein